jgi:cytoskeletal protein CcmA (bactofilin family)
MLGSKSKASSSTGSGGMSIIGQDVTITGNVTASGDLHLDGAVEGDISCAALTLGAHGRVKGHISADKAQLAGQVEGTVAVRELAVDATARISGDMSYENVSIAAGAHVDGRVSHRLTTGEVPLKLVAQSVE